MKLHLSVCCFFGVIQIAQSQVILSVFSQADSGPGSLRAVLDAANAIDLSDEVIVDLSLLQTISFPNPAVVVLSSGELTINRPMEWVTQGSPGICRHPTGRFCVIMPMRVTIPATPAPSAETCEHLHAPAPQPAVNPAAA